MPQALCHEPPNVGAARPSESRTVEVFSTELGWMALAHDEEVLHGLVFGHASATQAEATLRRMLKLSRAPLALPVRDNQDPPDAVGHAADASIVELIDELRRFAAGERVDFTAAVVNVDHLTLFGRRVTAACQCIPWGQTRTYGQLAGMCCAPRAARAVGQVMANNRYPLVVPCHRVLASGGKLGGYLAPQGLRMKRRLLAMENAVQ